MTEITLEGDIHPADLKVYYESFSLDKLGVGADIGL